MQKLTKTELKIILYKHKMWIEDRQEGQKADLRGVDLRGLSLRGVDLREADLQGIYLRRVDLQGANLQGICLRGADLREADLRGASLRKVDLQEVDLQGAELQWADLRDTGILTFQYNKHFAYSFNGLIKIGCEEHSISHWLKNYKSIGKEANYSKEEIAMYGAFIKMCAKHNKSKE